MNNSSVGEKIRELRKSKGFTLAQVAGEAYTKGYISQVELGRVNPSFKLLSHIANKLGIEVEQIVSTERNLDYQLALIEYKYASKKYDDVLDICKDVDGTIDNPTISKIKLFQVKALHYMGHYEECIDLATKISEAEHSWNSNHRLEAYSFIAGSLFDKKQYSDVIKLYDFVIEFAAKRQLNHSKLLANMYLNKATAYQNLGDYTSAIAIYDEAVTFARDHECMETIVDAYLRLGFCHYKCAHYEIAKKNIFNSLRINKALDIERPQAEALIVLSYIMYSEKNYKGAIALSEKALFLFKKSESAQGIVECLLAQAKAYMEINQSESGMKVLHECVINIERKGYELIEREQLKQVASTCAQFGLHQEASRIFSRLV
ncbi:helix-turn-helix domain-containing protein [Fusibacter sp. JL298sf-3]